jgi:hypothetical protein
VVPIEYQVIMRGARKRRVRAFNDLMTASYYASLAPHQKKLTPLADLLLEVEPRPRTKPTVEHLVSIARQWDAAVKR